MEFTGPGSVWYQTRGLDSFVDAIASALPTGDDNDATIEF